MANRENKGAAGTIITVGIVGGLAYWLYSSGMLNSIFSSFSSTPAAVPPQTQTPVTQVQPPIVQQPVIVPPVQTGPCSASGVLAKALQYASAAQGWSDPTGPNSLLNMDQWNYYVNQVCTGLSDQAGPGLDAGAVWPDDPNRGGPLNWAAYSGYARMAGLSGPKRAHAMRMLRTLARPGVTYRIRPGSVISMPMGTNIVRRGAGIVA